MTWCASTPANIALIKYMGKTGNHNQPLNSSLSYTLDHCRSFVEVELNTAAADSWQPLNIENQTPLELSAASQTRFLQHAKFLKQHFNCKENFSIRSDNNFPADCGLASSASSFAALTQAMCMALCEITQQKNLSTEEIAQLSRAGSGSSCRSFFSPWCLWNESEITKVELPYQTLLHQVIVVDGEKKSVSSSEAHRLVASSALFSTRKDRAETRLDQLLTALQQQHWREAYAITWQEFWDMHALFETSSPPFGYMTSGSLQVLQKIKSVWQQGKDGPIATMDAGANVHLLYREDQIKLAQHLQQVLSSTFQVISHDI